MDNAFQPDPTILDRLGVKLPDWIERNTYDRSQLDKTFPVADPNASVATNALNMLGRAPWELPYLAADMINAGEKMLSSSTPKEALPLHALTLAGGVSAGGLAAPRPRGSVGTTSARLKENVSLKEIEANYGPSANDKPTGLDPENPMDRFLSDVKARHIRGKMKEQAAAGTPFSANPSTASILAMIETQKRERDLLAAIDRGDAS